MTAAGGCCSAGEGREGDCDGDCDSVSDANRADEDAADGEGATVRCVRRDHRKLKQRMIDDFSPLSHLRAVFLSFQNHSVLFRHRSRGQSVSQLFHGKHRILHGNIPTAFSATVKAHVRIPTFYFIVKRLPFILFPVIVKRLQAPRRSVERRSTSFVDSLRGSDRAPSPETPLGRCLSCLAHTSLLCTSSSTSNK